MLAEDTIPQPIPSVSQGLIFVQELKRLEVILREAYVERSSGRCWRRWV